MKAIGANAWELADQLAQCREFMRKGLMADARSLNLRERPPLTERFSILNFPERQEFIDLCVDYGLQAMPVWDEGVVQELQGPVLASDAQVASLMQQWRKIGRNGTPAQKIQILRKIVASAPANNAAWKRNLAEMEKLRYEEIAAQLPTLAGRGDELELLEKISLELFSPDQLTRPNGNLVDRFKERLLPLQRRHLAEEMDKALDEIQLGYGEHDVEGIKAAYEKWKRLASSPLAEVRPDQEQTVQDAMAFVARAEEEIADKARYQQLISELRQLLEKNSPYSELERVYGSLQRMERELPQSLVEQVESREKDAKAEEKRLHVRRCVYGVSAAVIFLVLTFGGIQLLLYRNSVRQTCQTLARQKAEGLYEEGMEFYENLKASYPRVSRNSRVMALQAELKQALEERNAEIAASRTEFAQIVQTLENFAVQERYDSRELDELMKRAESIQDRLTEEQRKQFVKMREMVANAKEQIRENWKNRFLAECDAFQEEVASFQKRIQENHEIAMAEHRRSLDGLQRQAEQILATDKIDPALRVSRKNLMGKLMDTLAAALSEEEAYRLFVQRLHQPPSLEEYLTSLDQLSEAPLRLREAYAKAASRREQWTIENAERTYPIQFFTKYLGQVEAAGGNASRTIFYNEFKSGYLLTGKNTDSDALAELMAECDLFELVFFDAQGQPYFFYSKETPIVEWSRTRAGSVDFIVVNGEENSTEKMFFFKYLKKDGTFQFGTPTGSSSWNLPEMFASLLGWNDGKPAFAKTEFAQMLEWLPDKGKPPVKFELERAAWNMLEFCLNMKNSNPGLRTLAIKPVLKMLCTYEPDFYSTRLKTLEELLSKMPADWRNPNFALSHQQEVSELEQTLAKFDWQGIRAHREFQIAFLTALWKHELGPLGVLTVKDSQLETAMFKDMPSQELLVIENGELHRLFTPPDGGTIAAQDRKLVFNGQLIWGYMDGQSSEDFFKYWRGQADAHGYSLNVKTFLCPKELAYFLK